MTDIQIPHAMVEAAAKSRCERECGPFGLTWETVGQGSRDEFLACSADDLAAALGVCEVEEQEGLRLDWTDQHGGLDEAWESKGSGWARNAVQLHNGARLMNPDYPARALLIRRFVITTPIEQVDTEGAPK